MIPYDRDDPENVFTVELRTPIMHDSGIKQVNLVARQFISLKNYLSLQTF